MKLAALLAIGLLCLRSPALVAQTPDTTPHAHASQAAVAVRRASAFARSHTAFNTPATRSDVHAAAIANHDDSAVEALGRARAQHAAMAASPDALNLSSPWSPVGPVQVQTQAYGLVTGRVTSIAVDPNDPSNNTVYLGTSGGGVWNSRNAAGSQPTFAPLTDTLPVFSASAGSSVIPSLSVGAVSVQPGGTGVVLAGTGDPNDAADSYYGSGLLRSTDNGLTWSLITAGGMGSFLGEGFAGFAWSTVSPNVAVAAVSSSAESAIVKGSSTGVRGLYYTADGGATWTLATVMDGSTVVQNRSTGYSTFRGNAATAVVWNPVRKKFYAAIRAHGYYESADGQTWTRMANQPGAGLSTANCPARPGDYGLTSCPIFRGALAVQPTSGDLFALTVDAGNADQGLWQDACAKGGSACASTTVTWSTKIDASSMEDGSGVIPQGDYNLALAAVPAATALSAEDTLLFAGAGDVYRCSLAGGCTLRNTTNATTGCAAPAGVAPAQHAIAWGINLSNAAAPTMYFGNDGGLWRSTDGVNQQAAACSPDDATHFTNLNGALGSLAEVSSLAAHPSDPNILLAALGANGSAASTSSAQASAASAWTQLGNGESGAVAIDQVSGNTWLAQSGSGVALHTCGNGTACTAADFAGPAAVGLAQVNGDDALADPPALLDPALNSNLMVGTCRVWRGPAVGGGTWSASNAISPFLAGSSGTACNDADAYVRSLAAGGPVITTSASQNSGSSVLYAGLAGAADGGAGFAGHIYRTAAANTATATAAWTDLTNSPVSNDSNGFNSAGFDVSSIAVDRSDGTGNTVYATVMSFGVAHVYRSVNGGATWTNISANLPNAPANSVVVDPNDPLTVYVAMDTGVYVATDVTTCVTTNGTGSCWSVLGSALPNAPVLSLVATAGVTLPGASGAGALRAATYGRGIWQIPLVSAGQMTASNVTLSPASLTFAMQNVGSTSPTQTIVVSNTGTAAVALSPPSITGDFSITTNSCGGSLAANTTCTLSVAFTPADSGARTGVLTLTDAAGPHTVNLAGTGKGVSNIVLTPTTADFGSQLTGSSSAVTNITVSNTGSTVSALGNIGISGDFLLTANTCGASLPPQTGCTVSVVFMPTTNGTRTGLLTVTDNAGTQTATLTGIGTSAATDTLSPLSLTFAQQVVNTSSAAQLVNLTNNGDVALTLVSAAVVAGDFAAVNGCGPTVPAHSTCGIAVTFAPRSAGALTGTLQITDVQRVQTVALRGTAVAGPGVSLLPSSLSFAATGVGVAGAGQTLTLTNNGGVPVTLTGISVTGDFGILAGSNTCSLSASLAVGGSCSMSIAFLPTGSGTRTGTVTIASNAPTQIVQLTGTGIDFSLASAGTTSLTISSGGSAAYPLLLRPAVSTTDPVIYACTGAPAYAKCTITAQYSDLSAISTVTVTVLTGTATRNIRFAALLLPMLGMPWCLRRRRALRNVSLAVLAIAMLAEVQGCGSGRAIPTVGDGGAAGTGTGTTTTVTPTGTYNLTVSATAAGVTHSVPLTLVIR